MIPVLFPVVPPLIMMSFRPKAYINLTNWYTSLNSVHHWTAVLCDVVWGSCSPIYGKMF